MKDDLERTETESWRNLGTIPIFIWSDCRKPQRNEDKPLSRQTVEADAFQTQFYNVTATQN